MVLLIYSDFLDDSSIKTLEPQGETMQRRLPRRMLNVWSWTSLRPIYFFEYANYYDIKIYNNDNNNMSTHNSIVQKKKKSVKH